MKRPSPQRLDERPLWLFVGLLLGVGAMLFFVPQPQDLETALLSSQFAEIEEVSGKITSLDVSEDAIVVQNDAGEDFILLVDAETKFFENVDAEPQSFDKSLLAVEDRITVTTRFETPVGMLRATVITRGDLRAEEEEGQGYEVF